MSRYLICGSRKWQDPILDLFVYGLALFGKMNRERYTLIEGEAPGADRRARMVAEDVGVKVEPYPADWGQYRNRAGPIRNSQMLKEGKPKVVIAFGWGVGTRDMCKKALAAGLPVYQVRRLTKEDL